MNSRSKPVWVISFVLCLALSITPRSVKADDDEHSGSSGGGGGAVIGLVLVGLVLWAIFGKNTGEKKDKSDAVKNAPSAKDNKEVPPQDKGIGSNMNPEF